jgi:SAM-dependent methyltransferase
MFFDDAHAAFANIGQALRPGGQLALLTWQDLRNNDWLMTLREVFAMGRTVPFPPPAAPTPFSLADPDRVHTLLAAAGYDGITLTAFNEPYHFGDTADDALAFARTMGIVRGLTDELNDDQVEAGFRELRDVFLACTRPDGVLLDSAAWLVTAHR